MLQFRIFKYGRTDIMNKENKINIKAILIGFAIDFLGSIITGMIIMFQLIIYNVLLNGNNFENIIESNSVYLLFFLIGIMITILAGYVAGRNAKVEEIKHAAIVGIISNILGIFLFISSAGKSPIWYYISSIILVIPAAMLGGYCSRKVNKKKLEM